VDGHSCSVTELSCGLWRAEAVDKEGGWWWLRSQLRSRTSLRSMERSIGNKNGAEGGGGLTKMFTIAFELYEGGEWQRDRVECK
jgi:hypothetical protein